ncbi:MAG: hypothetical protein PHI50_02385 [Alphaproteobacteria bacterium]|nr:hypothetical protein [Alphaproteobacteria bacterium]
MRLCCAVDSSVKFKQDEICLIYKNIRFKYITSKERGFTDSILFFYATEEEKNKKYDLMMEFLRAFSYANKSKIKVLPVMSCQDNIPEIEIKKIKNKGCLPREIQIEEIHPVPFYKIALIDNEKKSKLLRLYTDAMSNYNIYFQILFLWHTIVFPNKEEESAIRFIQENLENIKLEKWCIDTLKENKSFGNFDIKDIGGFIKSRVRNAIAHICRSGGSEIKIDDLDQLEVLFAVKCILKNISEYKLNNNYNMNLTAGSDIYSFF